jgi:hypothetical protein
MIARALVAFLRKIRAAKPAPEPLLPPRGVLTLLRVIEEQNKKPERDR